MVNAVIKNIFFFDHNWSQINRVVRMFADLVQDSDLQIVLLSNRQPSHINGNLEVINILDVPQKKTLAELQKSYGYSLHKALVSERAFYDYSSFRRSQCYSRLSEEQIADKITPYVNALDYVIRERTDLIVEYWPDNFVSSVGEMIATHYGKLIAVPLTQYWWKDGALFMDRMNMTSTMIDMNYHMFYESPDLLDLEHLAEVFYKPLTTAFTPNKQSKMYRLIDRWQLIRNKQKYQPVSLWNWIVRRTSTVVSAVLIKTLIAREYVPRDEPFVIFPLHISPEAAILGTNPEMADQFDLIKKISMNLPYGVKLYVKMHPYEHLGLGLDYNFYRRLKVLPNVRVFDRKASLNDMLEHSRFLAIAILAGTSALDAVLKRKPTFVFGSTYYSVADCFFKPSNFQDFFDQLVSIMEGKFEFNERALNALLGALDKSIVRADVDLIAHDHANDLISEYPAIWQSYVEMLNQR